MARGRMLSKVISLDEKVNALSDDTCRLLFTWLIPHLDCEGRIYGDALTVKSIVFPRRSISGGRIEKYLKELEKHGLVFRYSVNGNEYLLMKGFEKHQPGLQKSKESPSQIPPIAPELLQSNDGVALIEVKGEVKTKQKEEGSSCSSQNTVEVCGVYQEAIGELSEAMENELNLAVKMFSASWVIDAIREAVKKDRNSWPYIAGILKNWKRYGKNAEGPRRKTQDPEKYVRGRYGKSVQR